MNQKVFDLIERIVTAEGFEFVTCETSGNAKQRILRVVVDRPDGLTLENCAILSRQIGAKLDEEDAVAAAYTLEVSSPGVERGLYRRKDFERFAGQRVKLKTTHPLDGQRNFRGMLNGVRDGEDPFILLTVARKAGGEETVEIPLSAVEKANLEVSLEELFQVANAKEQHKEKGTPS